jgi:hypothetical protein
MFGEKSDTAYAEVFCKAMAMPLVTEGELIDFLNHHPHLDLRIDGERLKRPDIQNPNDRVVRVP